MQTTVNANIIDQGNDSSLILFLQVCSCAASAYIILITVVMKIMSCIIARV